MVSPPQVDLEAPGLAFRSLLPLQNRIQKEKTPEWEASAATSRVVQKHYMRTAPVSTVKNQ